MALTQADFHLGVSVYSSDGVEVGKLEYLLADAEGMDPRHIVVSESPRVSGHHWYQGANLLVHEVAIPVEGIESAGHERVQLNLSLTQVRHLPPYVTYGYQGSAPGMMLGAAFGIPEWTVDERHAEPAGEIEIHKGEPLSLKDSGEVLGHVEDVVYDNSELVGVVVKPQGWFEHNVLLQTRFLERGDDLALFAHITEEQLRKLAEYKG